jgi:hypothetical protein
MQQRINFNMKKLNPAFNAVISDGKARMKTNVFSLHKIDFYFPFPSFFLFLFPFLKLFLSFSFFPSFPLYLSFPFILCFFSTCWFTFQPLNYYPFPFPFFFNFLVVYFCFSFSFPFTFRRCSELMKLSKKISTENFVQ